MLARLNKSLVTLTLGRAVQIAIMLISIKTSTHLLSTKEIGNLYIILTLTGFFGLLFINPVGQYVNRKTHEWNSSGEILNKLSIHGIYITFATLVSLLIIPIMPHLGIASSINYTILLLIIPLFTLLNTWNQTLIPMINMLGNQSAFVTLTLFSSLIALVCSYIITTNIAPTAAFWMAGQTLGIGLVTILSAVYFIKKSTSIFSFKKAINHIKIKNMVAIAYFATPLAISVFFFWLQSQSYRLLIENYIGIEFLGFFGIGLSIAMSISSSFESVITQWLYPSLYKSMKDKAHFSSALSKSINTIIPIYMFLAVCVSFLAPFLVEILVGPSYSQSALFLIFGIWVEFFRMSSNTLSLAAHSSMNTKALFLPHMIGGLSVLIGVYFAAQTDQYRILIPAVLLMAGLASFVVMLLRMRALVKLELNQKNFSILLAYSLFFSTALFFMDASKSILLSLAIVFAYGVYFLAVIFKFFSIKDNQNLIPQPTTDAHL